MKFIDLFAGIGGFHYGIDRAYELATSRRQKQSELESKFNMADTSIQRTEQGTITCVYSNEWDKYANSVYRRHYGTCDNRDIRTVKAEEIPDHDLLVGGFPCQAFSIAGKRGGFDDTRGTLFFDIARILREKQPRLCLLENVKGLLSHDNGRTIKTILSTLTELGYDVQWQVLNSKNHGVPQNRERIFIVGHLRGTSRPQIFPIGSYSQTNNELSRCITNTITARYEGAQSTGSYIGEGKQYAQIRRLTPIECERLQGFPDNWTKYGADGEIISDTQRYKMAGNAVTTNVITEIVRRLMS